MRIGHILSAMSDSREIQTASIVEIASMTIGGILLPWEVFFWTAR